MPSFKVVDYSPRFLPVDLSRQLLPGTFEYALHHLLDHEIDLSEIATGNGVRLGDGQRGHDGKRGQAWLIA